MSEETLKLAREWMAKKYPNGNVPDMWAETTVAEFAEQVARECAEIAQHQAIQDYDYECSEHFRTGYEQAAHTIASEIRAKF